MATDLERLVVQLSVDIKSYERALRSAGVATGRQTKNIQNQFVGMNRNISRSFDRLGQSIKNSLSRQIVAPLGAIGGALATQEVIAYADAWTRLGNKVKAASEISGIRGRTLEELNKMATATRGGLVEVGELYARILRSSGRVAKSELEVAQATDTIIKAFKAGGAAASEQAAGILQLGQALASGFLQGDELRSIRENATLLAEAIAQEFGVTIGELKELGAQGVITSDRVFTAILRNKEKIDRAFAATQSTIGEAFTRVENAFIQYIGQSNEATGASATLVKALNTLADNFGTVADSALLVSSLFAGALLGRSLFAMIARFSGSIGALTAAMVAAGTASKALSVSMAGISATGLGAVIGAAAVAVIAYDASIESATEKTNRMNELLKQTGVIVDDTATKVDQFGNVLQDNLPPEEVQRKLADLNEVLLHLRTGRSQVSLFKSSDVSTLDDIIEDIKDIQSLGTFGSALFGEDLTQQQQQILNTLSSLSEGLKSGKIQAQDVINELNVIATQPLDRPMIDLIARLRETAKLIQGIRSEFQKTGDVELKIPIDPGIKALFEQMQRVRFFEGRDVELAKTDLDRKIDELTAKIKKEADEHGVVMSEATARLRAIYEERLRIENEAVENFQKQLDEEEQERLREAPGERAKAAPLPEIQGLGQSATDLTQSSNELDSSANLLDQSATALSAAANQLAGSSANLVIAGNKITTTIDTTGASLLDSVNTTMRPLLDLITRAEGTAGFRGFNETLARGKFTGGDLDLVNMTLREILAVQQRMLADPRNAAQFGKPSSALGGFQIVSTTLRDAIKELGLSLEQKFDPQTQTKIAEFLAQRRIERAGGDPAQIVAELRKEWEGLIRVSDEQILAAVKGVSAQNANSAAVEQSTSAQQRSAQSARQYAEQLKAAGVEVSTAALDFTKVLGVEAAKKLTEAEPGARVSDVLTPQQAAPLAPLGPGITVEELTAIANATGGLSAALRQLAADRQQVIAGEQQSIENLRVEAEAMKLSTFEAEKLKKAHEILNEFRSQGITIGPQEIAIANQLATAFANQQVQIENLNAAQERAKQSAAELAKAQQEVAQFGEQIGQAFSGAMKGFISDLIHGKSLTEALRDALINLADQLISLALDSLFKSLFSSTAGTGGGLLGGLFHQGGVVGAGGQARLMHPAVFAGAKRYHNGSLGVGQGEVPAILKKGEIVLPDMAALKRLMWMYSNPDIHQGRPITQVNNYYAPDGPSLVRTQNQVSRRAMNDLQRAQRVM